MPVEMTKGAVDLSTEAMRKREFARQVELIAERERAKATKLRARAGRLALGSNGRKKLEAQAKALEEHAEILMAAAA